MSELRARVSSERTERTIRIEILDGPVIDVTADWHRKVRRIQVDLLTIRVVNGQSAGIAASGGMRRVDGTTSDLQRGEIIWRASGIITSPEWIQQVWREAPVGVTSWRFPVIGEVT